MTDYGTIKLPRMDYERHNQARKDLNMTWAEYIDGQAPEVPNGAEVDVEAIREELETDAPSYDDIKAACEAAIDDKLPEEMTV